MTLSSSGSSIAYWNYATWLELNHHTVPETLRTTRIRPQQDDHVVITATPDRTNTAPAASPSAGLRQWGGRILIVIDGGTGSSGESATLLLQHAFDAVLVGTSSYGIIDYGNSTPYYLPTSGMEIHLPSQANNWGTAIDFIGLQTDVPIPAATALPHIATNFERLHNTGMARKRR